MLRFLSSAHRWFAKWKEERMSLKGSCRWDKNKTPWNKQDKPNKVVRLDMNWNAWEARPKSLWLEWILGVAERGGLVALHWNGVGLYVDGWGHREAEGNRRKWDISNEYEGGRRGWSQRVIELHFFEGTKWLVDLLLAKWLYRFVKSVRMFEFVILVAHKNVCSHWVSLANFVYAV
jgi:hypothetical protein